MKMNNLINFHCFINFIELNSSLVTVITTAANHFYFIIAFMEKYFCLCLELLLNHYSWIMFIVIYIQFVALIKLMMARKMITALIIIAVNIKFMIFNVIVIINFYQGFNL